MNTERLISRFGFGSLPAALLCLWLCSAFPVMALSQAGAGSSSGSASGGGGGVSSGSGGVAAGGSWSSSSGGSGGGGGATSVSGVGGGVSGGSAGVIGGGGARGAGGAVHLEADMDRPGEEVAWVGVAADEATEALAAQLDLPSGAGLVAGFVDPEGPAAKAGLQKNDVLVRLDDQLLVHPAQFRKLVQTHKPGDSVKVQYYRAAKPATVEITLGKKSGGFKLLDEFGPMQEHLRGLQHEFQDPRFREQMREQVKTLRENLRNLKVDSNVQIEIRRSMDEAQKAIREAFRGMTNAGAALEPARKALQELAKSRVFLDRHATVTVHNSGDRTQSMVQTDEQGTIFLIRNPKLHLTAHDKSGKLLFDGEIETSDQRKEVPKEVWERTEPLIDKMASPLTAEAEAEAKP